jgi:hypothetical protein
MNCPASSAEEAAFSPLHGLTPGAFFPERFKTNATRTQNDHRCELDRLGQPLAGRLGCLGIFAACRG